MEKRYFTSDLSRQEQMQGQMQERCAIELLQIHPLNRMPTVCVRREERTE
jgi:hypothetical protein